jgi:hypothetical protein
MALAQVHPQHPWVWADSIERFCIQGLSCPAQQLKPLGRQDEGGIRAIVLEREFGKPILLGAAEASGDGYKIICWGDKPHEGGEEFPISMIIDNLYRHYLEIKRSRRLQAA